MPKASTAVGARTPATSNPRAPARQLELHAQREDDVVHRRVVVAAVALDPHARPADLRVQRPAVRALALGHDRALHPVVALVGQAHADRHRPQRVPARVADHADASEVVRAPVVVGAQAPHHRRRVAREDRRDRGLPHPMAREHLLGRERDALVVVLVPPFDRIGRAPEVAQVNAHLGPELVGTVLEVPHLEQHVIRPACPVGEVVTVVVVIGVVPVAELGARARGRLRRRRGHHAECRRDQRDREPRTAAQAGTRSAAVRRGRMTPVTKRRYTHTPRLSVRSSVLIAP